MTVDFLFDQINYVFEVNMKFLHKNIILKIIYKTQMIFLSNMTFIHHIKKR